MYLNKYSPMVQGATTEQDCSGGTAYSWTVFKPMQVKQLLAVVSTVMSSTAAVVLTFYRRPTYGSSANQVSLGTLTVGATAAVGTVYYKAISGTVLAPGEQVACIATTVASTSGKVFPGFDADENPEVPVNLSNMVAG